MRVTFASLTNSKVRDLHTGSSMASGKFGHQMTNIHQHGKYEGCSIFEVDQAAISRTQASQELHIDYVARYILSDFLSRGCVSHRDSRFTGSNPTNVALFFGM